MDRPVTPAANAVGARGTVASLHLFGVSGVDIGRSVIRMATDRRRLHHTNGLVFSKLLGTGDGRTFTPQDADPRLWGLFSVWENADQLRSFEASSTVYAGWSAIASETFSCELRPLKWKGSWSGRDPFSPSCRSGQPEWDGRVAALTRARIRPSQWRSFWKAVPPVAENAQQAAGLRFSVGIGEAPVGLQATFSIWDSAADIDQFAYRQAPHREVIRQTQAKGWYTEEMFIRFAVVSARGTVKGQTI
jgi:hypothetical protein